EELLYRMRQCHEEIAIAPRTDVVARRAWPLLAGDLAGEEPAARAPADFEDCRLPAVAVGDQDAVYRLAFHVLLKVGNAFAEVEAQRGVGEAARPTTLLRGLPERVACEILDAGDARFVAFAGLDHRLQHFKGVEVVDFEAAGVNADRLLEDRV